MSRKIKYTVIIILMITAPLFHIVRSFKSSLNTKTPCAFCDEKIIRRQKFYEDDQVIALYTHKPIIPSHFLIIPKRHVESLDRLSSQEVAHIHQVMSKVNRASKRVFGTSAYLIHQKNGQEVGQSVPHVHFHFIGKIKGDDSHLKFLVNMIIANIKAPLSCVKIQEVTKKMQEAMEFLEDEDSNK